MVLRAVADRLDFTDAVTFGGLPVWQSHLLLSFVALCRSQWILQALAVVRTRSSACAAVHGGAPQTHKGIMARGGERRT